MATEKDYAFVKYILDSTDNKKVAWEPTAEPDQFVASFKGKYRVLIDKHDSPQSFGSDYWLKLIDEQDHELLTVTSGESEIVKSIYDQAARTSLKVDEAIDEIMSDQDDIPF